MRSLSLWLLLFFASASTVRADVAYVTFPSDVDWVTRDSNHFHILYRRGQDKLALRAAKAAERAYKLIHSIFPPGPEHTWLVLADFQDSTNGYSLDLPWPHIVIFVSPPEPSGQLAALDDWLDSVILHEYVHTLHIYPASGLWSVARTVFGSWVLPNGLMPSHFHEGMAVELETEKTNGGRGKGTLFSMYRRMAVEAKVWGTDEFTTRDQMDGGVLKWPHGTSAYFFGYQLMHELHTRKGDQGIYDFTLSHSSNWPFFHNIPLDEVYHTDYPTLWTEIFKKTGIEAQAEIDRIKQEPLTPYHALTRSKESKWDLVPSPDGAKAAYRRWTPEDGSGIEVIDTKSGKITDTIEVVPSSAEGMCWGKLKGKDTLIFIEPYAAKGYSLNNLRTINLENHDKSTIKVKNARLTHLHGLACDPSLDRFLVYQESSGSGRVVEYLKVKDQNDSVMETNRVWKIPTGQWVTSLLAGESEDWFLVRDQLTTVFYRWTKGASAPKKMAQLKGHFYNLRLNGHELWAVADVDGRDEIWSLDFETRSLKKRVAVLGGVDSMGILGPGKVLLSNYTHGGYDIVDAPTASQKTVSFPSVGEPSVALAEEPGNVSPEEGYNPLRTLFPRLWIPNLLIVPDGVQIGVWIPGFDVSQKHVYNLMAGYDWRPPQGLPFFDLNYLYRFGSSYNFNTDINYSPSYFISNQLYLKQWGASAGLGAQFDWFPPAIGLNVVYRRMESILTIPSNQSVGLQLTLSQKLGFKSRPLSISPVRGTEITLQHSQFFQFLGSNDNYFSTFLGIDQYIEAPWAKEHVFYLAPRFGYTEGTTFLNNYFTAGGEILFSQARGTFLNRGFLAQQFFGRRIGNLNLEYRFPIATIERGWGYLPLKLRKLHAALVSDATTVDYGPTSFLPTTLFKVFYVSAGGELKSDWTFGSYLPIQLRLGGYHGFGPLGQSFYFVVGVEASL